MLIELEIHNFALLKNIKLTPSSGFTAITGETGAGKSIIFDALGLLLGDRADSSLFDLQSEKCIIEASFEVSKNEDVKHFLTAQDFDFANTLLLRREIANGGKTRSFINDTPASMVQMKTLGNLLVDIHFQHQTLSIFKPDQLMVLLDSFANNHQLLVEYQEIYAAYKKAKSKQAQLLTVNSNYQKQASYNTFLLDELARFRISEHDNVLENQIEILANAEEIQYAGLQFANTINHSEPSIIDQLNQFLPAIKKLNVHHSDSNLIERFSQIIIELKELANDCENIAEKTVVDEKQLMVLEKRYHALQDLLKKHQVIQVDELLKIQDDLEKEQSNNFNLEEELKSISHKLLSLEQNIILVSAKLHQARKLAIPSMTKSILELLVGLEIVKARMEIVLKESVDFGLDGKDIIAIAFSANSDLAMMPIEKVASGGETSRLALCLKSIASTDNSTLIFDEIDTGVSGRVAQKIGNLLNKIAEKQQVICITHSPQVASSATIHLHTSKAEIEGKTSTNIQELNGKTRIDAIAQMLSGDFITKAARENAAVLLAK